MAIPDRPVRAWLLASCALAFLLTPAVSLAEVELTPALGFRFGGDVSTTSGSASIEGTPALGLTADVSLGPEKWIVALWSHQATEFNARGIVPGSNTFDLDIDYLHAGGMYRPERGKKVSGFVAVTAGLTWVRPKPQGFGDELGLSLMVGGGFRVPLDKKERLHFRTDFRVYLSFTDITLSGVCGGVGCSIGFAGAGEAQFETLFGVTVRI